MQSSSSDKVTKAFILLYLGEILSNEVYLEFLSSLFTRSKLYRIVPRRVFKSLDINYKELQKHILNTSRIPKKDSTIEIDVVLNYLKDKNMLKLSEML
ncbi:Hypothetical protein FKW44_017184 [Caligus rogercresseyi]|uniref:Uncharacterized protein n=1 Tax=Caligus rogercresseyi TaxID=217165 RepID=A0A7T8H2U6_CALRO|nr:Hypothetical protein FKW44_017184 [Caligus rogercresseyi]